MDETKKPEKKERKKMGGRLKALLIFLAVILVLAAVIGTVVFRLPQRWGLIKTAGYRLAAETPERLSADEIVAEAQAKGFKPEGVHVFVFPKPDSGDAVLLASYDF